MRTKFEKLLKVFIVSFMALTSCIDSSILSMHVKANGNDGSDIEEVIVPEDNESTQEINLAYRAPFEIEGELTITGSQHVQEDKQHVALKINAGTDDKTIQINGIRGPDGMYIENNEIEYLAPCNGTYLFEVLYEKDGEQFTQQYLEFVFDSNRMTDGNAPSLANGFYNPNISSIDTLDSEPSTGQIHYKLYPYKVTVDGQPMGPGGMGHYVAYMQGDEGWAVYCLEPEKTAGLSFEQYDHQLLTTSDKTIEGKNHQPVKQRDLALTWFFTNVEYKRSGLSLSVDEWVFVCQIMIWEKLGYPVSGYDSKYDAAMTWVEEQIDVWNGLLEDSHDDQVYIWKNAPWPADIETVCGTGGTENSDGKCYGGFLTKDGKVNVNQGSYEAFDYRNEIANFGDPQYLWGDDAEFDIQLVKGNDGIDRLQLVSTTGGAVSIKHSDSETKDLMKYLSDYSSDAIKATYKKDNGDWVYEFKRTQSLSGDQNEDVFTISMIDSVHIGSSIEYHGNPEVQMLMQFVVPMDIVKNIRFRFSEEPGDKPSEPSEEQPKPKELIAPVLLKQDMNGNADGINFPIEGATFEFYAGETFKLHYVYTKEVSVYRCTGSGDDEVCGWEDQEPTEGKESETVWAKGDEVMAPELTPANGTIDTTPIIQNYYDAFDELFAKIEEKYDEKSANESSENRQVTYTVVLDPDYFDEEGAGWAGGSFYATEPHTSENTCNSAPTGNGTCSDEHDGYLNLDSWEKIRFEISEDRTGSAEQPEIIHYNERQRGRFTVHKVDNESSYLNHNNSHEPQGDGYFYGAVYVVTAKNDIVLHDGTVAESVFTGNPLEAGEVADVLVMTKTPDGGLQNVSTATTRMLELGEYAVQEVRLPGVYVEELPLVLDAEDGLYHVDPVAADEILAGLKDKTSSYYQFDYDKATELYNAGIIPIDSPDGGYWYKGYINGLPNTTNPDFVGGQTANVDIQYVGEDKAYNEVVPNDGFVNDSDEQQLTTNNGETGTHTMPPINFSVSRGNDYQLTKNAELDYSNSVQKGHIQLKKILTESPGIDGNNDNTGVDSDLNIAGKDIYFAIYLDRKIGSLIQDSTKDYELVDKYFAKERLDGLKYVYDAVGNFELYAEDEPTSSVTGYHKASEEEIKNGLGLVMVSVDGTTTNMKPADNYIKWEMREMSDDITASIKVNTYANPYYNNIALNNQNLSDKELYMILKTDNQGLAGTDMPHTIVWANYAALENTGNANHYGEWNYNVGSSYSKAHAEVLDYLHKNGLPLPYGSYTIVELNAPQGYEGVSWKAQISKNLTTYDINEDETVWELGIENSTEKYLSGNQNPQGWTSQQATVGGNGSAEDTTWLNKQFHIFSDYVSTSRYVGENIEDKLHRQILEIVKVDKETGKTIGYDSASFRVFQWNPMLDLNNDWKHAQWVNGKWEVTYEVPTYDNQGNVVDLTIYHGTESYTDSKGFTAQLGQWIVIPANGKGIYTTDSEGKVALSQPLPPADYFLLEIKAPEGYLLHDQAIPFSIEAIDGTTEPNEGDSIAVPVVDEEGNFVCKAGKDCNNPESPDYALDKNGEVVLENCEWQAVPQYVTITITAEDMPQKGYVEIEKTGSIFDKFVQYVTDFVEMIGFKPMWKEDEAIKLNTTFCIYAREDIMVNGEAKYTKDECIQKMATNDEGHAFSEALYLGKYYVKECDAPHGYITSGEEMDFELAYDDQKVIVHPDFKEFPNERQKFNIHLHKSDEEGNPLEGAVFGIFAGEDLPKGIQHEEEPEKTGNETLTMDEMDVSLNGEWQNVCKETETGIVCDSTFVGEKTAVLNAVATDKERFSVPDHVTIDGEEFELTTIGAYAFMNCNAKAITLPATIEDVEDYAFAMNDELEYLHFTGKKAPEFAGNIFPTGHELLGIYIPWSALSIYDLALVDGMADNNGSKDQRLMGIPLKNENELFDEDEGFNQNPFDTDGFANFGKVEDAAWTLEKAEAYGFALEKKTKSINGDEFAGYFITGYAGGSKEIFVPEKIIDDDYDAEAGGKMVPVVGIDAQAFYQLDADTILIPDTIRYIGNEAFADNDALSMIRFYETDYREFEDESGNGSLDVDDDMQINPEAEICNTSGGTWKDTGNGAYACAYSHEAQKTTSEEECTALGGTYADGVCTYQEENFGEMPEPNLDAGMSVAEIIVGRRFLLVGIGRDADVATPNDADDKSNSQIACEANGGAWDSQTGTCSGGESEVEENLDGGFDIGYRPSNSQTACEAKGGTWNDVLGTCSLEYEPDWDETPVYISESAFDFTANLTWIVAGEFNWYRFDTAYIVDSNDDVLAQDGDRDGSLWWNPEAVNPQTGKPGYWELGEDKPALLGYPITINRLTDNEDPIDPGIQGPDGSYLPSETTGIKEGTLIEVIKTDINGHANTQFDYPEGKYYVRELKAPEGYEISRETYPIELTYQENDEPTIDVYANNGKPIINKKKENHPLRIEILKVDSNDMKPLAGAEFQLWNHDRTTVLETLVTDATGKAVTKGLYDADEFGGYLWLKETKAPEGYEIIGDGWTKVHIDESETGATTLVVIENYTPEKPPHEPGGNSSYDSLRVKLVKKMEGNIEEAWKDVVFGIFAAEDIYSGSKRNPKLVYEKDEMLTAGHIDENGIFNVLLSEKEFKLEDGNYYVQEIKTNDNYVLDDTKWYFDYDRERDGSTAVVAINDMKPIINELKEKDSLTIEVMKVDEEDHTERLAGAKFILVKDGADWNDIQSSDIIATAVSGDNGLAYFKDVAEGIWWIKEIEAPVGYEASTTWKKVTVNTSGINGIEAYDENGNQIPSNDQGDIVTIVWPNRLLPGGGQEETPDTGAATYESLYGIIIMASAAVIISLIKSRKNS